MERANVPATSSPRKRPSSGTDAFPRKSVRKEIYTIPQDLQSLALLDQQPESVSGWVDSSKEVPRAAASNHSPPVSSRSRRAKTTNGSRTAKSPFSSFPTRTSTTSELRRLARPRRTLAEAARNQPTDLGSHKNSSRPEEVPDSLVRLSFQSPDHQADVERPEQFLDLYSEAETVFLLDKGGVPSPHQQFTGSTQRSNKGNRARNVQYYDSDASETSSSLSSVESSTPQPLYPSSRAQTLTRRPKPANISYTISQDHTAGDTARRSNLLAAFGKKKPPPLERLTGTQNPSAPDSTPAEPLQDNDAVGPGSNLFVTGIHPRLSEADVTRLFERYGEIEKCQLMLDPHTKESRGFGFVKMVTAKQANNAKEGLQGEVVEGRTLSIEIARRSRPRTPTPGKYFGPPKRGKFSCAVALCSFNLAFLLNAYR